MTRKKQQRYLRSWAIAHALAFDVPPEKPERDAPAKVKAKARRGLHAFQMAIARGTAPRPDMRRGITSLWDEEKFEAWKAARERETKKADECANTHRPKSKPHGNEAIDGAHMPRRKRSVNANGGVSHGGA